MLRILSQRDSNKKNSSRLRRETSKKKGKRVEVLKFNRSDKPENRDHSCERRVQH